MGRRRTRLPAEIRSSSVPVSNTAAEGAFQEYTVVLERLASPIPDTLSYERACVLPLAVSTAAVGLFQQNQLALRHPSADAELTGDTVLVWGGSTSVGSNAIQLAVAAGHDVITTASPRNFDHVTSLGASQVFDYHSAAVVDHRRLQAPPTHIPYWLAAPTASFLGTYAEDSARGVTSKMPSLGALCFGLVIGWITYRTVRRSPTTGLKDIAIVIGAVGGAAVTGLFPSADGLFALYSVGLAIGFFGYLATALVLARQSNTLSAVGEWLGDAPMPVLQGGQGGDKGQVVPPVAGQELPAH